MIYLQKIFLYAIKVVSEHSAPENVFLMSLNASESDFLEFCSFSDAFNGIKFFFFFVI